MSHIIINYYNLSLLQMHKKKNHDISYTIINQITSIMT